MTLGRYIMATKQAWHIGEVIGYLTRVAIEVSREPERVEVLRPVLNQVFSYEYRRKTFYWSLRNQDPAEELAPDVRTRYPAEAIVHYRAAGETIKEAWKLPALPRFDNFACISVMVFDRLAQDRPDLMQCLVQTWPPASFISSNTYPRSPA